MELPGELRNLRENRKDRCAASQLLAHPHLAEYGSRSIRLAQHLPKVAASSNVQLTNGLPGSLCVTGISKRLTGRLHGQLIGSVLGYDDTAAVRGPIADGDRASFGLASVFNIQEPKQTRPRLDPQAGGTNERAQIDLASRPRAGLQRTAARAATTGRHAS